MTAVTPDQLRLSVEHLLRSATVAGFGSPLLTDYPEVTAEAVMARVTPVLEARDERIADLERTLREVLDQYGPRPYPGQETAFFRGHLAVSAVKVDEWWRVLEGKDGSEEKGQPS